MNYLKLKEWGVENFGPFLGRHVVSVSDSGLTLIEGTIEESAGGSGAGKSFLLNALSYLFGGCPFSGTELQSWYTDEPPRAWALIETQIGEIVVERCKGLSVKVADKTTKGKAAEQLLDSIFGMDEKFRAVTTYRPQRTRGLFLSMSDVEKKEFLSRLLNLDKYEAVAAQADKEISEKTKELLVLSGREQSAKAIYENAIEEQKRTPLPEIRGVPEQAELDSILVSIAELKSRKSQLLEQKKEISQSVQKAITEEVLGVRRKWSAVNIDKAVDLVAAETELTKIEKRLSQVQEYNQTKQTEHSAIRTKLMANLAEAKAKGEQSGRIEDKIKKHQCQEEQLRNSLCPVCGKPDPPANILQTIVNKITQLQVELTASQDYLAKVQDIKDEIETLGEYVAHPAGPELVKAKGSIAATIKELQKKEQSASLARKAKQEAEEDAIAQKYRLELQEKLALSDSTIVCIDKEIEQKAEEHQRGALKILKYSNDVNTYKRTQKTCEESSAELSKCSLELDNYRKTIATEQDLKALVGREGFLAVIFDDVLAEIAMMTNQILGKVANVSHIVFAFESEREAKTSGNVIKKITPVIYSRGRKVSFGSGLSGGMQSAVDLAVDLAVARVIAARRGVYPGWLILDEAFEGLDTLSKESCMEMLSAHAVDKVCFVVDHATETRLLFSNTIKIKQLNGISSVA